MADSLYPSDQYASPDLHLSPTFIYIVWRLLLELRHILKNATILA